jgi:phage tail sheath gpL-like
LGVQRSLASLFIRPAILLVGMYDPAKTSTVDYVPIKVLSADDVAQKAGFGSHAHRQALRFPSSVFNQGEGVYWVPVPEEAGGTAATDTITFTGTATSSGTFAFLIGGERVTFGVQNGDDATAIGTALNNAITAVQNIAVTSGDAIGVVTNTCKFKGTQGNQIKQIINPNGTEDEKLNPSGVTVAFGNADGFLSGGATDPDLEDVFFDTNGDDKLGDRWYTQITCPFQDATNLGHYKSSGDKRSDPAVNRFFGAVVGYVNKTYSEALAIPATINSEWIGPIWDDRYLAPAFELGAEVTGIIADEQNQSPSRPYKTIALQGAFDSDPANLRQDQLDALFRAGMSYCKVISSNLRLGDIALSYRTNDQAGSTEEWFDMISLSLRQAKAYSLEQLFLSDEYGRAVVVTNDDVASGVNFAIAPKDIVAAITKLVTDLWLFYAWTKNGETVINSISAEINAGFNGRIDSEITDDEAKALRIIALSYKFLF